MMMSNTILFEANEATLKGITHNYQPFQIISVIKHCLSRAIKTSRTNWSFIKFLHSLDLIFLIFKVETQRRIQNSIKHIRLSYFQK